MASDTTEIRSTLNDLIQTCKDGEEGFKYAAEHLVDGDLRQLFQKYSAQRAQFASELQVVVAKLGGDPSQSGTTAGAIHRGWIDLKGAIAGRDDHSVLEEAERGEDAAIKSYRDAMVKDLPKDIHAMIERQYKDISQTHNQVRSLRDSRIVSGAGR